MQKYFFRFKKGSKINQIICAILINIPAFAYGMSIGWMSPMSLLLQSENSPRGNRLTDSEVSWMASAAYMVCIPSVFIIAFISDKVGRKAALMLMSLVTGLCWILKLSSMETWAFVTARAMIGFTMAGAYVTCPIYTKEISEASVRGLLGSLLIFAHTGGNLFLYIIGDLLTYRAVLWVCLAFPLAHMVMFLMMPESPSYLVKKEKYEEASRVLDWLRCRDESDPKLVSELEEMKREQKADDETSKFILKNILNDYVLFRAFRVAMLICLAREVCGAIPVLNFAGEIFERASTSLVLSPNQQAMLLGVVQVTGSALGTSLVEKAGRKPLLFITSLVSGLTMCVLASWFLARDYEVAAPDWIPVATLCLCIFCDSSGLQPVSVVLIGEMFSFKYRGTVMATSMAAASIAGFLQTRFFKPLVTAVGIHVAFYFYGAVCLAAAGYIIFVVPETKMKSVDEIYERFRKPKDRLQQQGPE